MKEMSDIDKIIYKLFSERWYGDMDTIEKMRSQLHKNLTDQINGWWSGHTAYHLMIDGGFLVEGKSCTRKKPTALGALFIEQMGGLKHDRVNEMAGES